jgi:predicted RNA binding protein YcfA (HicA-like mRNA interferase family)
VYNYNVSGKDFVKKLMKDGWELDRVKGSHHIMRKNGVCLSVPVHGNKDLKPGIFNDLNKKAGYKK